MSQTLAAATSRSASHRPATGAGAPRSTGPARGAARPPRPALRVVQAPLADRGRTLFVATCLLLLVGGLLALLMLNTAMANGSFRLHDLQETSARLAAAQQAARQDLGMQAAPARLASRAKALGMVPAGSPAFIRLSDGKVLGVAKRAQRPPAPTVKPTTAANATAAAKPTTTANPSERNGSGAADPATTAKQR